MRSSLVIDGPATAMHAATELESFRLSGGSSLETLGCAAGEPPVSAHLGERGGQQRNGLRGLWHVVYASGDRQAWGLPPARW